MQFENPLAGKMLKAAAYDEQQGRLHILLSDSPGLYDNNLTTLTLDDVGAHGQLYSNETFEKLMEELAFPRVENAFHQSAENFEELRGRAMLLAPLREALQGVPEKVLAVLSYGDRKTAKAIYEFVAEIASEANNDANISGSEFDTLIQARVEGDAGMARLLIITDHSAYVFSYGHPTNPDWSSATRAVYQMFQKDRMSDRLPLRHERSFFFDASADTSLFNFLKAHEFRSIEALEAMLGFTGGGTLLTIELHAGLHPRISAIRALTTSVDPIQRLKVIVDGVASRHENRLVRGNSTQSWPGNM